MSERDAAKHSSTGACTRHCRQGLNRSPPFLAVLSELKKNAAPCSANGSQNRIAVA